MGCVLRYFLNRFVEVFNGKLFTFSQLLESPDGDIVDEPESCTRGVGHDVAALDLDCPSGVMEVNSNAAKASLIGQECEMDKTGNLQAIFVISYRNVINCDCNIGL